MIVNLIATSVVRGSHQGESHGGVFLINLEQNEILQPIDWNTMDIDWQGRGWDRGLRGIAFHNDQIYIAASDELFLYDSSFNLIESYRNEYLKHCHEICVYENHLFVTSTGFDSILAFDLAKKDFSWGLFIKTDGARFIPRRFDPHGDKGPLMLNKLHLNNVFCDQGGMFISGMRTGALLIYSGSALGVVATLPDGTHNARPFRTGMLFNDTKADAVRLETPESRAAFRVPRFSHDKLTHTKLDDSRIARQGFARGLCLISDEIIAGGSSPSTISIHDLQEEKTTKVINLTMDMRNAIHGLEVWPFDWPEIT